MRAQLIVLLCPVSNSKHLASQVNVIRLKKPESPDFLAVSVCLSLQRDVALADAFILVIHNPPLMFFMLFMFFLFHQSQEAGLLRQFLL